MLSYGISYTLFNLDTKTTFVMFINDTNIGLDAEKKDV